MRMIYVGPSQQDDPIIHSIMAHRIRIVKEQSRTIETAKPEQWPDINSQIYGQFIANLNAQVAPITEIAMVVLNAHGKIEFDLLEGKWDGVCEFHDQTLPGIREQLRKSYSDDCILHVDLGDTLSSLYAAYFAVMDAVPTTVTFHGPTQEDQSFMIGGHSTYANRRPMIRRKLLREVLTRVERAFVSAEAVAAAVSSLMPELDIQYYGDPLTVLDSPPEAAVLSSSTGDGNG